MSSSKFKYFSQNLVSQAHEILDETIKIFKGYSILILIGLVFQTIIVTVLIILARWTPALMLWMMIGASHGLLMIGKCLFCLNPMELSRKKIDLVGEKRAFLIFNLSINFTLAAIIGFGIYAESTGQSREDRIAGLIIGIMSIILLIVSISVLISKRTQISHAITSIKGSSL